MHQMIAVVGMCGSGKSVACDVFRERGWEYIRFGQITMDKLISEGREVTPENEREVREALRAAHGMAAFAKLSIPKIDKALEAGSVVIDGLYSWAEYKVLKEKFGETLKVLCVYAPPALRYERLAGRLHDEDDKEHRNRQLSAEEARKRDYAEIEKIEKGGPIAMADFTLSNLGGIEELKRDVDRLFKNL